MATAHVREWFGRWLRPADLTPEEAEAIARGIYSAPAPRPPPEGTGTPARTDGGDTR